MVWYERSSILIPLAYIDKILSSKCGVSSSKIASWAPYQAHDEYFAELMEKHKRKLSFLLEYKIAIQKYTAKESGAN